VLLRRTENAFEIGERVPTMRHATALRELCSLELKAERRFGHRVSGGGTFRLKTHYLVDSNRNHARRSASSIQISIRLVVA